MKRRKFSKDEIKEYRESHNSFFYFNINDSNFFVPKAYGIGNTFNWAHPFSWILILALVGYAYYRTLSK